MAGGRTIFIAGAGIAGLTLALALAKFGATVVVLERNTSIQEVGAGLQISPNARRVLNRLGIAPSKAKVLVLGAGYKRDLGDARESPSIDVMRLLIEAGCTVFYHDPYVPEVREPGVELVGIELTEAMIRAQDLVVIATDHSHVDYAWVVTHARHVLDTRRATRGVTAHREKITLL